MENLTEQDTVQLENLKNRKEDALKSLELVISWVNNIDAKASYILAVAGVMIGYVLVQDVIAIDAATGQVIAQTTKIAPLRVILYIFCMLSFILPILTLRARTKSIESSNFFFSTIENRRKMDFIAEFKQMSENESLDDILAQVHINSKICSKKVKLYNWGLVFLLCSILLCFACKISGQI